MTLELDHLFCLVDPAGDFAARAAAAGYALDDGIRHPGQGTRNRRLPLAGMYLELLWIDDPAEAAANPLGLDRRAAGGNPLGVGLRGELPDITWVRDDFSLYEPPYAPGARIWVHRTATTALDRPFLFVMEVAAAELPRMRARLGPSPHTVRRVDLRGPGQPFAILDGLVAQHPAAAARAEVTVDGPALELGAALAITSG